MGFLVGIDVGGTFTDGAVITESGEVRLFKTPTVPQEPSQGFIACLDKAARAFGLRALSAELERAGRETSLQDYKSELQEVVQSRGCALHLKAGDKLVITSDGLVLADESTAPLCLWALAPLVPWNYMVYDRLIEGQDPCEFGLDRIKCLDVGLECGGWGEVLMKVYCVKDPWSSSALYNRRYVAQPKEKM